jgi:hypothetical protein
MGEGHMKKHTVYVGNKSLGETVSFTAKSLGTAYVNGGKEGKNKDGMDWTYYRLPDNTYRMLIEAKGGVNALEPANAAEALKRGEPIEYRSWTYEELQNHREYGHGFVELMKHHPEGRKRNVRDLDQVWDEQVTEGGMEKHTLSVGTDTLGETVRFTAKQIGKVEANGGSQGGGMDITFYRLPDHTYRALVVRGDISILEPSNFAKVFGNEQPADYGRWTLEELQSTEFYGEAFTKLMAVHPDNKERNVRDLD